MLNLVDVLDGLKITPTRGELEVTVLNDAGEEVAATLVRPKDGGKPVPLDKWPEGAQETIKKAGLTDEYKDLLEKI